VIFGGSRFSRIPNPVTQGHARRTTTLFFLQFNFMAVVAGCRRLLPVVAG